MITCLSNLKKIVEVRLTNLENRSVDGKSKDCKVPTHDNPKI